MEQEDFYLKKQRDDLLNPNIQIDGKQELLDDLEWELRMSNKGSSLILRALIFILKNGKF